MSVAIGVHNFGGAFTYGLRSTNWRVPATLEETSFGVATSAANNVGTEHVVGYDAWKPTLRRFLDDGVDLAYGNPACSCWSQLGRSMFHGPDQWRTDPNFQQTVDLVTVGDVLRPTFWVTESVPRFWRSGAAATVARFWLDRGYDATLIKVDGKFLGLPQQRRRVFVVAHRYGFAPTFPEPEFVPVGMAIEGIEVRPEEVPPTYPLYLPVLRVTPQGRGLVDHLPDGWTGPRPRFVDVRLAHAGVAGTIAGFDTYYHPTEDRKLSVGELAALCGYPSGWRMTYDEPWQAIQQLAKAVLPPTAAWLGGQLLAANADRAPRLEEPSRMVTHWATSGRLADFNLTSIVEPWKEPWEVETIGWLEERVRETREKICV